MAHDRAGSIDYLALTRKTIACVFCFKVAIDEAGIVGGVNGRVPGKAIKEKRSTGLEEKPLLSNSINARF